MTLKDRTIVVFGGSAGIGKATAERLASQGADVLAVGRDEGRLATLRHSLPAIRTARADIREQSDIARVFSLVERVDHVVVTAGTFIMGPVLGTALSTLRQPFEERVFPLLNIVQTAAPKMKDGSFLFLSGILAARPQPGTASVAAAIAAVESLVRTLAIELAPIRVNVVAPGVIATELIRQLVGDNWQETLKSLASGLPGKRPGTPDEVASVIQLALENGFLTGEILTVDGGGRYV